MTTEESRSDLDLFARAAICRKAIIAGIVEPWDGLYYTIFPTLEILKIEAMVNQNTMASRVYRDRRAV